MPPLRDVGVIEKLRLAYEERNSAGVLWKRIPPSEWLLKHLDNYTTAAINDLTYKHILSGGPIYVVKETREEYLHHKYHYDFHISLPDFGKELYVETTLMDSKMGPVVTVVNVHWAD